MPTRYLVTGHFQRSRTEQTLEHWEGMSRNMLTAMRCASKELLRRPSVKRLRHQQVTFTIERMVST